MNALVDQSTLNKIYDVAYKYRQSYLIPDSDFSDEDFEYRKELCHQWAIKTLYEWSFKQGYDFVVPSLESTTKEIK